MANGNLRINTICNILKKQNAVLELLWRTPSIKTGLNVNYTLTEIFEPKCPPKHRCLSVLRKRFGHNGCTGLDSHRNEQCFYWNWRRKTLPVWPAHDYLPVFHRLVFVLSEQLIASLGTETKEGSYIVRKESSWEILKKHFSFFTNSSKFFSIRQWKFEVD